MSTPNYSDPKTLASLQHLRLRTEAVVDSLQQGLHLNDRSGYSIEFSQHREYSPGDDLRALDWKAYARTDRFYLKQFQDEARMACYLMVDGSRSMSYRGPHAAWTKYDFAACLASALAWLVVRQRDAVGLTLIGEAGASSLRTSDAPQQWAHVVDTLEAYDPATASESWEAGLERAAGTVGAPGVAFLISDGLDEPEALGRTLRLLREVLRLDVRFVQVLDPEERELTLEGPTEFQDLETGVSRRVVAADLQQAYAVGVAQHLEAVSRVCAQYGVGYWSLLSTDPLPQTLKMLIEGRPRRLA